MIRFIYPTDGDMLTNTAGVLQADGSLLVEAAVQCDLEQVSICGVPAEKKDGLWLAQVPLQDRETRLTASAGQECAEITVYRLLNAAGHYSLSVDDNIWWLAELTEGNYASLFDHPYLAVYRRAHEQYGAKVRLNLFYAVSGDAPHARKYKDFNLSQMTDRYRDEFIRNSDWLHLAFHSRTEFPNKPYIASGYDEVAEDCRHIHQEICRFAGEETLEKSTTVHFGECSTPGRQALMDQGVRALMGYISLNKSGKPSVSYELTAEKVLETQRYGFWHDHADGMTYGKIDVVLNLYSPEKITELLEREHQEHPLRGFVEIMIHEQYFYEDYGNYEPDYEERIMAGCKWCHEKGMKGMFFSDALK